MKNIVIIGAGYSGILSAKGLADKFKKSKDVSITIIDKNPFHTMLTELHEVAAGRVDEESIKISLAKIFAGRNVNVLQDTGKNKTYNYDYVVIAAGSRPTYFGIKGAKDYTYPLWSYEDAIKLQERILNCFRQAAIAVTEQEKRNLLTFYVVGAGFTGAEMVGELAEYVPILCEKFEIDRKLVTLCNIDVLPHMVPNLPEKLSLKIKTRLERMGVNVMLNTRVVEVGDQFINLEINGKQTQNYAGTVVWVAGVESSEITEKASQTLPNENRGRLKTDEYLRSINDKHVYITGDNIYYIPNGEKTTVPQMVENCEQSAHTVANNIYTSITGKGSLIEYKPKFHGVMVSVGGRYGVARVGTAKNMMNLPSFLAMFVKHFINIIYFAQVLGWNKIASYLKHEFFTIKHRRSFVGGHFTNRTPSFLLVPLRIWLGIVWLFEGVLKVIDGWFITPKLEGFFGTANVWFDSLLNGTNPNVVSGATETVEQAGSTAGEVLINFNFIGLFKIIFVSGRDLAESTLEDFAFKLDIPVLNWFINTLVVPYDGVQLAMQIFIVISEILIGLSLIGGLFTTPSSAFSVVLLSMFICTTGLYLSSFWMIFAAIALLIAAGRIFGLDYYAMPYFKKRWKKIGWVRRSYLYHD